MSAAKSPNSTRAVHAGAPAVRANHTLAASIAQTATYTFENTADLEQYMRGEDPDPEREEYGRYGNPTVRELEQRVTALESAEDGVAFSSGMAAISTAVLSLVKTGEHVVLFNDCYRRTRQLVRSVLPRFGIEHDVVPAGDLSALEAALRPTTRLVLSESPTNPFLYCVDLQKLSDVVKRHGRIRTLVDSTMATPINCRPLDFGVDLVVHSATKYLSGHNDVLGGVAVGAAHLVSLLRDSRGVLGTVLDPHAAFLIQRGLKTYFVRYREQTRAAQAVAEHLAAHPAVARVHYPGLPGHPQAELAKKQMREAGTVVTFDLKQGSEAARRFCESLKLFALTASLGSTESLVMPPQLVGSRDFTAEQLRLSGIGPGTVRLSIGLEDIGDLIADIDQALAS